MNDIFGVLAQMGRGDVAAELNRHFEELVGHVLENAGKGELTLKVKLAPSSFSTDGRVTQVDATHAVTIKRPVRRLGASTFFVDHQGVLTRNSTEQMMLDMQEEPQRRQ